MNQTTDIADNIIAGLTKIIPGLAPYEKPLAIAVDTVATIAPALYTEIKTMIAEISAGKEPTPEQLAALADLVTQLKNPEQFFQTPLPVGHVSPVALNPI